MLVLDPISDPNWSLSMQCWVDCNNQLYGKDSRTSLRIGVREIGRKSESTSRAGDDFGMGVTFADFHKKGTNPSRTDALKIDARGRDSEEAFSQRNHTAISSGPIAELSFVVANALSVSSTEIRNSEST